MADRKQLEDALIAAHNAGDTEAAQMFAGELKQIDAPDNSPGQWMGVVNRALAPYAVAGGAGAVAGAPFAGVGAIPGAAGGVLSLGLGDLGTAAANVPMHLLGKQPFTLPSEAIRNLTDKTGITRQPETPAQRIAYSMANAGGGALSGAGAAANLAPTLGANTVGRGIAESMAANPGAQTAAGMAAGGAGQVAAEAGAGPVAQTAAEFLGSLATGKIASSMKDRFANAPPSREQLKTMADTEYAEAKKISFDPKDVAAKLRTNLNAALNNPADPQLNARLHPKVAEAVADFRDMLATAGNKPIPFSRMEQVRKLLTRASISDEADERRVAGLALDQLDSYVNSTAAKSARELWARRSKAEVINQVRERADLAAGDPAAAMKSQFRTLANQLAKNSRGFRKDEIAAIRKVAEGGKVENLLQAFGMLAPGSSLRGTAAATGLGGLAYGTGSVALPLAIGSGALASRGVANALARRSAGNVDRLIRRGEPVPSDLMFPVGLMPAALDTARNPDKRKR